MLDEVHKYIAVKKPSLWLLIAVIVLASTMMHPTFASLIAIVMIAALLNAMRWVAHVEGRYSDAYKVTISN